MVAEANSESFEALSSPIRLEILRLLARKERRVSELAELLRVHEATIRYHIATLSAQGLLKATRGKGDGKRGRPATRYRLLPGAALAGYPTRHYEILSETLLKALRESLSEKVVTRILWESGEEAGRALGEGIIDSSPDTSRHVGRFASAVAKTLNDVFGIEAGAEGGNEDEAILIEFTCPFEELALKYADLICDHLDRGFHEGLSTALGENVSWETQKCKGHGDDVCQFKLTREAA